MPGIQDTLAPDLAAAVEGNTAFALDLLAQLHEEPGNVVVSPFSVSSALAMTYAGARGETERQIARAMHFTLGQERLHPAFSALHARLGAIRQAGLLRLEIANSLWPQVGYPFLEPFVALCLSMYGVSITGLDYTADAEACRLRINSWAEARTEGHIKGLIPPGVLDFLTRLVLVNAVYFKGNWQSQFEEERTHAAAFHVRPGVCVQVPLMAQRGIFGYARIDGLKVLELPYAGGEVSMTVLLPEEPDGLPDLERTVTPALLAGWLARAEPREVEVAIPRLRIGYRIILNRVLAALGMPDAFEPTLADLAGMDGTPHWLYIGFAVHQAFMEVNEQGTEAATSTAVVIKARSLPAAVPSFRANHPFLLLIRERETGTILFLGRVADPAAA